MEEKKEIITEISKMPNHTGAKKGKIERKRKRPKSQNTPDVTEIRPPMNIDVGGQNRPKQGRKLDE